MNFLSKNITHNSLWVYFILLIFSSCSKKLDVGDNSEKYQLTINVKGVKGVSNGLNKGAFVRLVDYQEDGGVIVDRTTIKANDGVGNLELDFISSAGDIKNLENVDLTYPKLSKLKKTSSLEPMEEGVKYFFIIYKKAPGGGAGDFVDARLGTVGEPMNAWVNNVDDFIWYAYSFNSSEDIERPDYNNPEIQTRVSDPLLFATGELLQANISANYSLPIEFDQKLSKLEVEVDCRSMYADVISISGHFVGDPIAKGTFNLKGNSISNVVSENVGNIQMRDVAAGSRRLKESVQQYYTVKTNLSSYQVQFTEFKVRYPNRNDEINLLEKISNYGLATFSGFTPGNAYGNGAKLLKGTVKPYLVIPSLKIMTYGAPDNTSGFQAQANTASGNFIRATTNIGPNSKYIRVTNPTFVDIAALSDTDELEAAISSENPDIIICSALNISQVGQEDLNALVGYINSGGVAFLLTESEEPMVARALESILGGGISVTLERKGGAGAIYEFDDVDTDVLNGVFGDIRGKSWGQDGFPAQYIFGAEGRNDLVVYTRGSLNYANDVGTTGITMFRTTGNKHLFFCGDTGVLAGTTNNYDPYEYVGPYRVTNNSATPPYFPAPRGNYGTISEAGALEVGGAGSWTVYNSYIFGNALAWLVERVYFWGRDANGTLLNDEVIQTKENNWNFRRD